MSSPPPWDSDEYDREVRESRKRARQQERLKQRSPVTQNESRGGSSRKQPSQLKKEAN